VKRKIPLFSPSAREGQGGFKEEKMSALQKKRSFRCPYRMRICIASAVIGIGVLLSGLHICGSQESKSKMGVGFLIGKNTTELIPLLTSDGDFLEMVPGPDKVQQIRSLNPQAKAMCVVGSLEKIEQTVSLFKQSGIGPERIYIAYNPEPREHWTPDEEIRDFAGSLKKAREMLKDYPAELVMGPGLIQMGKPENSYTELAKFCDIWMLQSQNLQVDFRKQQKVTPEQYRESVKKIVDQLRQGNPDIRVFVQVIPLTRHVPEPFTARELADYLLAVQDMVESAKIYGGNTEIIREVIQILRSTAVEKTSGTVNALPVEKTVPVAKTPPVEKPAPPEDKKVIPLTSGKQTFTIEMRDKSLLATDLYMPADYSTRKYPGGLPLILVRTPYDKSHPNKNVDKWRDCFINNGYAFAVQDMRGFYGSKQAGRGSAQYDGYDTVEWFAKQPWCNGKVGMMGFSHLGAAQYEAAVTNPPHLVCAIPSQAPGNYYTDSLYPPVFRKADMETILRGPITSKINALMNTRIRRRDISRLAEFSIPMLHSAGWYDFYKEGAVEMFNALQSYGGTGAKGRQKLFIGPWGHGVSQEEDPGKPLKLPGGLAYPANVKLDWEKDFWLPWFDYHLKGKDTGVMDRPAVRYYLMGDVDNPDAPGNVWVEDDNFPPESVSTLYYTHQNHSLSLNSPSANSSFLQYRFDPENPVPTVGRTHVRLPVKGPYDQRETEGREDVLIFTTPVLETPLKIVGQVKAKVWASSDRKDTDFTVKITDVYPDGRSMFILDGIVKAKFRNSYLKEEFLDAGKIYEFDIDLGYIAIVLAKGHKLRLAISSSNFDRWDINPNTGQPYGEHSVTKSLLSKRFGKESVEGLKPEYTDFLVATNKVYMDKNHPTHLILPVIPSE
jgi:uncharacterized protein